MMKKSARRISSKKRLSRSFSPWYIYMFGIVFLGGLVLGVVMLQQKVLGLTTPQKALVAISHHPHRPVCSLPSQKGTARCHAQVITNDAGSVTTSSAPGTGSFGPVQFHTAYNLPCTPGGQTASVCPQPPTFGPQTIAIVDAYNDPTVESDLNVYNTQFGLPSCTMANGCLTVVNQNGGTTLPATDSGWALEISLDVQAAHAICQTCKILLVEASSSSIADLGTAVNTAAALGATAISNSYGAAEWSGETYYDQYYNHPGIAVTASTGDSGYGTSFPAASPHVVAVGGTTVQLFTDNTYASESAWSGSGSGCSTYEQANSWQTTRSDWSTTGCGTSRGIADTAADADPNTGAAVYDSTPYNGATGWFQVGGTSLSSPLVAAVYALTGSVSSTVSPAAVLYSNFTAANSHDILSGSTGSCSTSMCKGSLGYDGPTGLGTANGLSGFMIAMVTNTPTPTNTPIPTSTIIPTPTLTADSQAPSVQITSPINGATVSRRSSVTVSASATDNVGVNKVVFYVNNSLVSTDTTVPYAYVWQVPNRRGTYTLAAKAFDAAGNSATSTVTVTAR